MHERSKNVDIAHMESLTRGQIRESEVTDRLATDDIADYFEGEQNMESPAQGNIDDTFLPEDALALHCCDRGSAENEISALGKTTRRRLRFLQRRSRLVGSEQRTMALIEVLDEDFRNTTTGKPPSVFAVRHAHGSPWGRQTILHRSLLVGCLLADVKEPPVALPPDSAKKLLENVDQAQHLHSFMERLMIHIKFPCNAPPGVRLLWWRPVGCGAIVLLNETTGRLLMLPSPTRKLSDATTTLRKTLDVMRAISKIQSTASGAGGTGFTILRPLNSVEDPVSPATLLLQDDPRYTVFLKEAEAEEIGDPDLELSLSERIEAVQRWAVEESASPWLTNYVVAVCGLRKSQVAHHRYSIDVDPAGDEFSGLSIQVHVNEPLSREMQAFPVCLLPLSLEPKCTLRQLHRRFRQALWFMRKFYDFHVSRAGKLNSSRRASTSELSGTMPIADKTRIPASFAPPAASVRARVVFHPSDASTFNSLADNVPQPLTVAPDGNTEAHSGPAAKGINGVATPENNQNDSNATDPRFKLPFLGASSVNDMARPGTSPAFSKQAKEHLNRHTLRHLGSIKTEEELPEEANFFGQLSPATSKYAGE